MIVKSSFRCELIGLMMSEDLIFDRVPIKIKSQSLVLTLEIGAHFKKRIILMDGFHYCSE